MIIFQAIYAWAEWPMNLIDTVFLTLSQQTKAWLPAGALTNLLAEGIIPGLGGIVIFIPQIALLFAFIFVLEETGYMARVVFIMDRLMRPFGLNGKSVVPLISGVACAIPAIMATRTIDNWKDRLLTILVTPLMSCSARLPVYTLLIALVVPTYHLWGIVNVQGLVLLGMYLLGLIAALGSAALFRLFIQVRSKSFLVMELPLYKTPRWKNVLITLWEKSRIFVWEAGKVIMAISVILWVGAAYGPEARIQQALEAVPKPAVSGVTEVEYENQLATARLENSYIGLLGQQIEPVIRPLGYNWQIGIALITSFAAREVFVGSMATIYSVGEDFEENESLLQRMQNEINPQTGRPVYTLASGLSLMVFYAFAMQCMSTLAIVYRETKSWKWPLFQTVYMTALAYLTSLIIYQWLK
jgi:ferrous iron transport protein B